MNVTCMEVDTLQMKNVSETARVEDAGYSDPVTVVFNAPGAYGIHFADSDCVGNGKPSIPEHPEFLFVSYSAHGSQRPVPRDCATIRQFRIQLERCKI